MNEDEDLPEMNPKDELERLMKEWTSPIYAFFHPCPAIIEVDGQCAHVFKCAARHCSIKVRQYNDTKDARSTSNLWKHVKVCKGWGNVILKAADQAMNAEEVREKLIARFLHDGTITAMFERMGKGKLTYLNRSHTHDETRYVSNRSRIWWGEDVLTLFSADKKRLFDAIPVVVEHKITCNLEIEIFQEPLNEMTWPRDG